MKEDRQYLIVQDIPLDDKSESVIKKGRYVYRTHGCYYLDGGFLSPYFQDQFDRLIEYEEKNGWKYLKIVR